MKLLVFTDTHSSTSAEKKVIEKAEKNKPEIILCCGDFTIFMNDPERFLRKISNLGVDTYIIHGNHEDEDDLQKICKRFSNVIFLHNKVVVHKNLLIMGYGGGGFSHHDSRFDNIAKEFEIAIQKYKHCKKILVLHQPPHKSGIDLIYGVNSGNMTTKKFVEKHKIHIVFAGHLHENSGMEFTIKETKYINPGPFGKIISL